MADGGFRDEGGRPGDGDDNPRRIGVTGGDLQGPGGAVGPDIGLGNPNNPIGHPGNPRNTPRPEAEGSSTPNEASPQVSFGFTLRHFLRENADGARGGYMDHHRGDMGQGLPDFVQDHLVVEQAYLSQDNRGDMRFDLTEMEHMPSRDDHVEGAAGGAAAAAPAEVGSSKSLPDFLSDGPIRQRDREPTSLQVENERIQSENERLRIELGTLRQQLNQQVQRNEDLWLEVAAMRSRSGPSSGIERLQEELDRVTGRALRAENRLSRVEIENNTLKAQLLRSKNRDPLNSSTASTSAQQTQSER